MLASLFGSKTSERVLIFLFAREEGYAREIARFYGSDLKSAQNQLDKFEAAGILSSRAVGRTRPYMFNPRYPFLPELKSLLEKALTFYPEEERERLVMNRRRPRGKGKAL
ncbi:MAG: winged helix-turn-helix domain-containing protein [Anaerolineales bacterium]|nr:winged helix-turn-helix domain-containing protein [Anaerolineales bacterium]